MKTKDYRRVPNRTGRTVDERFWEKVHGKGAEGCWEWNAAKDRDGYGMFSARRGSLIRAHIWAYTNSRGAVPDGFELDHVCENTSCVNPWHLEPVTRTENNRRRLISRIARSRTVCKFGHDMTDAAVQPGRSTRTCRQCNRLYNTARSRMTREQIAARKAAGLPVVDLAAVVAQQAVAA